MFSKKAKALIATAVLTALGVAVTGVASARLNSGTAATSAATMTHSATESLMPMHDNDGRGHLDAVATALGMTVDELRAALVPGTSLADIAATKGVAVQKVIDAIVATEKAEITQHVADGKITQTQADELLAGLAERVTTMVNADRPAFGHGFGKGDDNGEHGFGRGGHGRGDHGLPGMHDSTVLEDTLGMTREEIRAGLEAGKSIADLAKEKGVDVQKVIDALVAEARTRITDMVNGKLPTADQNEDA